MLAVLHDQHFPLIFICIWYTIFLACTNLVDLICTDIYFAKYRCRGKIRDQRNFRYIRKFFQ